MAWDFSTEPEFQEQLDWVEQFCREEVEPLDLVFPGAVRSPGPEDARRWSIRCKQQVKDRGLWALFLDEELGGPGFGQLKLALLNEILGRLPVGAGRSSAPGARHRQHGDPGRLRHRGAEGALAVPADEPGDLVGLLDDRAAGRVGPQPVQDPRGPRRRRVGHQRREVVHQRRPPRRHPVRHVHERHVRRAARHARRRDHGRSPRTHDHIRYNDVRVPLDHLLGPGGRGQGAGPAPAGRRADPPRHADHRPVQAGLRHDVRAGPQSRESHGKVIAEHQMVQEEIADSYAEINMLRLLVLWTAWTIDNSEHAGGPDPDRRLQVHVRQGAAGGRATGPSTSSARWASPT